MTLLIFLFSKLLLNSGHLQPQTVGNPSWKQENEPRTKDSFQQGSSRISNSEERFFPGGGSDPIRRSLSDCSTVSSRSPVSRTEEPVGRFKTNNRVAIFRDREIDRADPDYDRSYDRYMQRFDPGFGYNGGPYAIQPMYAPALTYNTEFPQLGSSHRPPISTEHQPRPIPQHLPGPWVPPSAPAGIEYGPPETMMTPFSHSQVGARTNSAVYLHSAQYPSQHSGMQLIHPHEAIHQPFPQDAQFTIGKSSKVSVAFWYPEDDKPWHGSAHYSISCDWISMDFIPGSSYLSKAEQRSPWDAATTFSLLFSVVAFSVSIFIGYRVSSAGRTVNFAPINNI